MKESVQEKEERLREKLKRKAEENRKRPSESTQTGNGVHSSHTATDAAEKQTDNGGKDDTKSGDKKSSDRFTKKTNGNSKDMDKTNDKSSAKSKDTNSSKSKDEKDDKNKNNAQDKKLGRRGRRGRNRRRRQRRQERQMQNAPPPHHMLDNRSYYQDHPPYGGGSGRYGGGPGPGGPGYRGGPGGGPGGPGGGPGGPGGGPGGPGGYHRNGPGPDGGRWGRDGPPPYDRYYDGRFNGGGGGGYGYDRGFPPPRGGGGHRDDYPSRRGPGRPSGTNGERGGGGGGGNRNGNNYKGPGGSRMNRGRSRSFSRSRSRSSEGSYTSSDDSSKSSRSSRSSNSSYSRRGRSRSRSVSSAVSDSTDSEHSRSHSRSVSRSASRSPDRSSGSKRKREDSRSRSRSVSQDSGSKGGRGRSKSQELDGDGTKPLDSKRAKSSEATTTESSPQKPERPDDGPETKDRRTIFISQLVMRADEKSIRKYFRKQCGKVNDVILLRDKRTGRHKGCAYVELARLDDVPQAILLDGKAPDFQRFPILIKGSEAEKNYNESVAIIEGVPAAARSSIISSSGKKVEAQKVYVGSVDRNVTQAQLYAIFSQFGQLNRVMLQIDTATGLSRGFAFLSFEDPKVANLSIQVMSGQVLAGRQLRTGWANYNTVPGLEEVTSQEFPDNAIQCIQNVNKALITLNGTGLAVLPGVALVPGVPPGSQSVEELAPMNAVVTPTMSASQVTSVAEQAINAALGLPSTTSTTATSTPTVTPQVAITPAALEDPKKVANADSPSRSILIHNMFNKDEETDPGWEEDIKLDFQEESEKHGKITFIKVMSKEVGGKIYASFESLDGAKACAENLAGRWFDKRQLRVEYVSDEEIQQLK